MMTSITARHTAVIDPSPSPPAWSSVVRKGDGWGAPPGTAWLEGGPGAGETRLLRHGMNGETDSEREKRVLGIWLQVPPCSVAPLKHTITQSRAIIRQRERNRGREADREQAHFEEHYTEQRSAFTRAVITAAHSVHLTSPLDSLSSRFSVIHIVLAQSTLVCLSGWNNRIHLRKIEQWNPNDYRETPPWCHDYSRIFWY